jgi:MinD-like ATPase involved in chromosome partitioning or flagellar assembly
VLFDQVLKIAPGRVVIAFNRRQDKVAVNRADIERSIQRGIDAEIPFVGSTLEVASVKGELLVVSDKRGAFAKAIDDLVRKVSLAPISSAV